MCTHKKDREKEREGEGERERNRDRQRLSSLPGSTSLLIRGIQVKTTMKCCFILTGTATIKNAEDSEPSADKGPTMQV